MPDRANCLIDRYTPPVEGFTLESLVATTYTIDFEFLEEDLIPAALGVRTPVSRNRAFRSEVERRLRECYVTVLYDLRACDSPARTSRRIDPIPIADRKLHSKISLLIWRGPVGKNSTVERRARLLVGSANLTRPGFRENYEIVASIDFGGPVGHSRRLLLAAIAELRSIARERMTPQLRSQLDDAESFAHSLAARGDTDEALVALVGADTMLATIESTWREIQDGPPSDVLIVSPFWPEGADAVAPFRSLIERVGRPKRIDIVCASHLEADGKPWSRSCRPISSRVSCVASRARSTYVPRSHITQRAQLRRTTLRRRTTSSTANRCILLRPEACTRS